MKKWSLVISVVVVIAMLGAGALAVFHDNQQVADYVYGSEAGVDVADEVNGNVAGTDIPQGGDYGYDAETGVDAVAEVIIHKELPQISLRHSYFNPDHTKAYERLVDAIPYLSAQGIPVVDFRARHSVPDPDTRILQVMVVTVGLREIKDEYKEAIKEIVKGIKGVEFEFFQAEFTSAEISSWQAKIWGTFSRPWDLPPGIIEVPVSGTISSWRRQRITVRIAGEIQPQYIEVIRTLVGNEAPLYFQGGGRVPHHTRYWREMRIPDEEREKHDIFVHILSQIFPDVDLSTMRIGEVDEFIKGLSVEEATQAIRLFLDYAVEKELVIPEERQGLEEETLQHWREWRQE